MVHSQEQGSWGRLEANNATKSSCCLFNAATRNLLIATRRLTRSRVMIVIMDLNQQTMKAGPNKALQDHRKADIGKSGA